MNCERKEPGQLNGQTCELNPLGGGQGALPAAPLQLAPMQPYGAHRYEHGTYQFGTKEQGAHALAAQREVLLPAALMMALAAAVFYRHKAAYQRAAAAGRARAEDVYDDPAVMEDLATYAAQLQWCLMLRAPVAADLVQLLEEGAARVLANANAATATGHNIRRALGPEELAQLRTLGVRGIVAELMGEV